MTVCDIVARLYKNRMATSEETNHCSICLCELDEPRVLPCIHSFCLECLERYCSSRNKLTGDDVPCPECRTEFNIPKDGVAGLTARTRDFARIVDDEIGPVTSRLERFRGVAAQAQTEWSKMLGSMQTTEREIKNKGEEVKQSFTRLIDRQVSDLLHKLQSMKLSLIHI